MWSDRAALHAPRHAAPRAPGPTEPRARGRTAPRARLALAACLAASTLLAACTVSPVHGRFGGGAGAGAQLGLVAVAPVQTRVAQRVRNALIETLGRPTAPRPFGLTLDVDNRVQLFLTDFETDRASAGTVTVTVAYTLTAPDGTTRTGRERARSSFDAPLQEFARQRAIRDAENRAAREVAQRVRLAILPVLGRDGEALEGVAPLPPTGLERDPA